jgi:hypothetical protein
MSGNWSLWSDKRFITAGKLHMNFHPIDFLARIAPSVLPNWISLICKIVASLYKPRVAQQRGSSFPENVVIGCDDWRVIR